MPWSYTWIRQENCNSNKGKAKYIDNRVAVAAVKYAVDQNNYVALEALAPKFDEEVD